MPETADELARRVAAHMLSREGTGPALGIAIDEMREGYARLSMTITANMLNGYGTAHGGMIFALADTAFAYACNSRNVSSVAQQASIVFLTAVREGERLTAEASEHGLAGRSGVYSVIVRNTLGAEVAVFQGLSRAIGGTVIAAG
jgi:acyl-CoA thioesterase